MLSFLDILFDFHLLFSMGSLLKYFPIILVVLHTMKTNFLKHMSQRFCALYSEIKYEKKKKKKKMLRNYFLKSSKIKKRDEKNKYPLKVFRK